MKQEELFEVIGEVDGTFIKEAAEPVQKKRKTIRIRWIAAAACVCLLVSAGILLQPEKYGEIELPNSGENVVARYISEEYLEEVWQPMPDNSDATCYTILTEKDIFTTVSKKHLIVKGKVTDIRPIEIAYQRQHPKAKSYGAIVELFVEKVYYGDCKENSKIELFLYYDFMTDTDILYELEVGDSGIFMPRIHDDQAILIMYSEDDVVWAKNLADYGIEELFVFMETENGMEFTRSEYPGIKDATTYEEVEAYIYRMMELYSTEAE